MADIKVVGHNPPDSDSTCSPIVYAWYLNTYQGKNAKAYIGSDINKETRFILNFFGVETPEQISQIQPEDEVVLLDTNNPEELISGCEGAQIIEIIDHHKLSGLKTANPLNITFRSYGSVPTVMWELFSEEAKSELPKDMAGLMLSCILSDTLKFTSPTTTEKDKEVAQLLAEKADVNIEEYAPQMFAAKSNLEGMTAREVLMTDQKNFELGGKLYKVAVLETTDPSQAISRENEIKEEISKLKAEENLAGVFFFVVDILNTKATLLETSAEEKEILEKAFGATFQNGYLELPGIVSRKKQMIPALEKVLG